MAFDINTAKPVKSGGFDMSTAKPETEQKDPSLWEQTKAAVKGNAEHKDAISYEDWQWSQPYFGLGMDNLKVTAAGMFGNDEDKLKSFQRNHPQHEIKNDSKGNPYFVDKGQVVYIDWPGLDAGDIADFAGEALTYGAGGMATAPIKGLGKRVGATAAVEGGINAGAQKLAGRDEIDKGEMFTSAALGGTFEALTPLVSATWRKIKGSTKSDMKAGAEIAQEMGLQGLSNGQVKRLGNMVRNIDPDQVSLENIISHVELNQIPTRGSLTGNQKHLDREHMMMHSGRESTQNRLNQIAMANEQGMQDAMSGFQDTVAGGQAKTGDYLDAASQIGDAVKQKAGAHKQAVNQAYDSIDGAYLGTAPFKDAPNRIKKALSEGNVVLDPSVTPRTNAAINDMQKSLAKMGDAKAVSWQAVDSQRKRLNSLFKGADDADKRALTIAKNQYGAVIDDAFENALFSGSDDALNNLKGAREIAADYFKKYQKNDKFDKAGRVIDEWVNSDVAPENIAKAIFNVNGTLTAKAPDMAKRYMQIFGKDSAEHQLMKELAVQKLTTGKSKAQIRTTLKNSLANQKTFMNEIFSPKELGFMSRAVQFIDGTTRKGDLAKSSGTAERVFRWVNNSVGNDISLSGMANTIKKVFDLGLGFERRALSAPMKQLNLSPAAGVAASQGDSIPANDRF